MKPYILFMVSVMVLLSTTACGTAGPGVTPSLTPAPPASEQSGAKIQEIKNRGMLIVSVKKTESPTGRHRDVAHFQKRDFEVSIAKAIAKKLLGDENKIELKEFKRADRIPAVERNEVDLAISSITITEDSKKIVNFSDVYDWEGLTLMTKKGAGIRDLEDLNRQTVAAVTEGGQYFGDALERIAKERGLAITAKSYVDFEAAAAAVEAGQMPAVVQRRINILVYMAQKPGVFETVGGLLTTEEHGIAVKKGNDDLLAVINSVITELMKSGELNQMAEKAGFPIAHIGQAPALAAPASATTPTPTPAPTPVPGSGGGGGGTGGGTGGGGGGGK